MHSVSVPAHLDIHGIRLVNLALDEAVAAIDAAIMAKSPTRIAFVNADCVNIAATDADYRQNLADMDWIFVDGIGMRIAGKMLQQPVRDNVNGTDLFPKLCASMAQQKQRLYLLGARPGVAEAVGHWVNTHHPGVNVVGTQDGYFNQDTEQQVLSEIRAARPDVVLVAIGAPRQETWINQHIAATGASVVIGVGGLFDYYSGRIPRAPLWMRRFGLEWLFRLSQEPARLWRRYLIGNGLFMYRIVLRYLRQPQQKNAQANTPENAPKTSETRRT